MASHFARASGATTRISTPANRSTSFFISIAWNNAAYDLFTTRDEYLLIVSSVGPDGLRFSKYARNSASTAIALAVSSVSWIETEPALAVGRVASSTVRILIFTAGLLSTGASALKNSSLRCRLSTTPSTRSDPPALRARLTCSFRSALARLSKYATSTSSSAEATGGVDVLGEGGTRLAVRSRNAQCSGLPGSPAPPVSSGSISKTFGVTSFDGTSSKLASTNRNSRKTSPRNTSRVCSIG